MKNINVGLIGDFDKNMYTHIALNECIDHCRRYLDFTINAEWLPTDKIAHAQHNKFDGYWITPGSPYRDDNAVYNLLRHARESDVPVLGTCGGFQYMIVEYARHVMGIKDADHEETNKEGDALIVIKMSCSLKGQEEKVFITEKNSWLYKTLQREEIVGKFNCSYGVNPSFQQMLNHAPLVFTAFSGSGEARAVELRGHIFFNGTLFQPPLDSSSERPNALVLDFFKQVASRVRNTLGGHS